MIEPSEVTPPMTPAFLALAVGVAAPALKDKPAPQDLYGEWEFESTVDNGREAAAESPPYRYRFNKDGTWQVLRGGQETGRRRGFKFDPSANPPTLDTNISPTDENSPLVLAIYGVDGDRLTICKAFPGKARPTAFTAPAGTEQYLIRLHRVKPSD
jgi:uncharacterized protein (TIGR03067 family)